MPDEWLRYLAVKEQIFDERGRRDCRQNQKKSQSRVRQLALIFDAPETSAVILHNWHYYRPKRNREGSEELTLEQLKNKCPDTYKKAIQLLAEKGFPSNSL